MEQGISSQWRRKAFLGGKYHTKPSIRISRPGYHSGDKLQAWPLLLSTEPELGTPGKCVLFGARVFFRKGQLAGWMCYFHREYGLVGSPLPQPPRETMEQGCESQGTRSLQERDLHSLRAALKAAEEFSIWRNCPSCLWSFTLVFEFLDWIQSVLVGAGSAVQFRNILSASFSRPHLRVKYKTHRQHDSRWRERSSTSLLLKTWSWAPQNRQNLGACGKRLISCHSPHLQNHNLPFNRIPRDSCAQ